MKIIIYIQLILVIFAAGCSVGPDYMRPTVDSPDSLSLYQDIVIEDSLAISLADTSWWDLFGDSVLTDLIRTAVRENYDIKIAAARVDEYMGMYGVANSDYYPKIDAGASGQIGETNVQGTKFRNNRFSVDISAFWEIDIWGKYRRANEAALANLLAAEETRRGVILTIVSQIAVTYFDLLAFDTQLEITKLTVESRGQSLDLFRQRWDKGDISQVEINQLESEYWYAKSQIPRLEQNIIQLQNAMSVLIGRNPGPITRGRMLNELALPEIPASMPSKLLERRPDVLLAENQLISANAQIGVVKSLYYPSLSLTGLIGFSSNDLAELFEPSSLVWNAGAGVLAPLFRAGEISEQVNAAEAIQRQAFFNYMQSVQNAFRDAQDALIERVKTEEKYYFDGKRRDALLSYRDLSLMKYNEGATSYLEVLDAERNLFASEFDYTESRATMLKSVVKIFSSLAGGWLDKSALESYQPVNPVEQENPEEDN